MDFLKNIKLPPPLDRLLKWEYWPYYLAALVVLLLVALLILLVMRRRGAGPFRKSSLTKPLASGLQEKGERFPRYGLKKVWKKFIKQIPLQFRRAILLYKPFVVLGGPGTGKSLLIDNYTDWRGQANRFYPSYTVDPLLQIYLGSKALVMEIPAGMLNNTSRQVRDALLSFWKPLFKKKEPVVVVVLNGASLSSEIPENLRSQAQTIRGKINILSSILQRPVKVCLALTHMDQIEGYNEFAAFFRDNGIPLNITFSSLEDLQRLETCLEAYEVYLTRALKTVSSGDYLKILSFFKKAPETLSALSSFVKVLHTWDSLSLEPQVTRMCFNSHDSKDPLGCDPFTASLSDQEIGKLRPHRKHQLAAAALLLIGMAYLSLDFLGERGALINTDRTLNLIEASPPDRYDTEVHRLFVNLMRSVQDDPFLNLPPCFFPNVERDIRQRMVRDIRKGYLIPDFMRMGVSEDSRERGVYLLGLIYATKQNELGKLILRHTEDWEKALGLPRFLILDYLDNNENVSDVVLDVSSLHLSNPQGISAPDDPLPWMVFFRKAKKACDDPYINKEYLHGLQKDAAAFLKVVERVVRYKLTNEVIGLLKRLTPVGSQVAWLQRRNVQLEQEGLRGFLAYVGEKDIVYPPAAGMSLFQFIESLKVMTKLGAGEADKEFQFSIAGEQLDFKSKTWDALILRSRVTLFMREFIAQSKKTDGLLFFGPSAGYPDLVMNASNDGLLFFTGKGKVDGRFTKSAFEQQVKPVLTELPDLVNGLPLAQEEKSRFSSFILKQAEAYADRYIASYRSYYSQFHLQADSLGGLKYLLKQVPLPTSPFQDFLFSMKENTVLDIGDGAYLRQFAKKLGTFDFVRRLMAEKEGAFPELDKYKAILQQMDEDIESNEPFAAKNKADDSNELKGLLSPLGRISLSIFRGENDSYMSLVRMWLKSVGIDAEWQGPFLDPVQVAFFLGRSDVETSVDRVWSGLVDSYIKPIRSHFPFNPKADVEISPSELERIAHPQGAFWKSFRDYLAPLCKENNGIWTERVSPQGLFRIPEKMLKTVNEMSRLASAFWTDKGVSKPVSLQIKPYPLPPREEHLPVAILSYLRCDKSSVFAFNQQPAWQKLDVEWWKHQTAAVGLEFETVNEAMKSYRELSIAESSWGFFHLLRKAETVDKNVFMWRIEGPGPAHKQMRVEFSMKSDPWAIFRIAQ